MDRAFIRSSGAPASATTRMRFAEAPREWSRRIEGGVIMAVAFDPSAYDDECFAELGIAMPETLGRAVPKRRAEYLAGRYAAAAALEWLGRAGADIKTGSHREPVWPDGIAGSISHNGSLALCAASRQRHVMIGIDVETIVSARTADEIGGQIIDEDERAVLVRTGLPFHEALTLAFSAKESLFKALFPRVGRYFDFPAAAVVRLDRCDATMDLRLTEDLAPGLLRGLVLRVEYRQQGSDVVTLLVEDGPAL